MESIYINNHIKREKGKYVCPHNEECRCDRMTCSNCGWHPAVAKARMDKILKDRGV